jgi:hypothetical protein
LDEILACKIGKIIQKNKPRLQPEKTSHPQERPIFESFYGLLKIFNFDSEAKHGF